MEFTGKNHRRFDNTARREWQNPEAILKEIGLKPGSIFVDIGCGNGFFTLPAARMAGKQGKVFGIDVSESAIEELKENASKEGLGNIALTIGKAEETILCRRCADIVFFGISLHDFQDPPQVLENARNMLKPGGRLIDLDWKKKPMPLGPPLDIRYDEQKAGRLIESAGFTIESVKDNGEYHYVITANPSLTFEAAKGCRTDLS